MPKRTKASAAEFEKRLKEDAGNPDAWEYVTTVRASAAPRPAWYGRSKHLELAAKFYVLSVLHRLGAEATLTYAQPDSVDITAVRQSGEAFTIDVKTLTGTREWSVDTFRARPHHFVVFVCFPEAWRDVASVPELYLWQSERLESVVSSRDADIVSLPALAAKHDSADAWRELSKQPAA